MVYGNIKLSNNSFESIKIDFSDTVKQYNYQDLANEEKKKLKDLIFLLDRFGISDMVPISVSKRN